MRRSIIFAKVSIVAMVLSILSSGVGCIGTFASAQLSGQINVLLNESIGVVDPKVYGHFTEETLSSYEGAVSSEMLFNRKFEIPEERDIKQIIFKGVSAGWEPIAVDTNVTLVEDTQVYFSPGRSQRITLSDPGVPAGIQQDGYQFVMPHLSRNQRIDHPFRFEPGERYLVRLACMSRDPNRTIHVAIGESHEKIVAKLSFNLSMDGRWRIYSGELKPSTRVEKGKFLVYIDSPGTVWIDSISLVRADLNEDGFRKDALDLTRRISPTSIRWPGGWFASDYHWKDGIGPIDERPARFNRTWNAYTTNDVGTDEFIVLCRKLGAEPYITVNVGTGTAEEAAQWVEYCNGGRETKMGRLRAQHGHPEPYGIKYWSIGNEEYLPTIGGTSGREYGRRFNAFARAMRAIDPTIKLVAVGAFDIPGGVLPRNHPLWNIVRYLPDWNKGVLTEAAAQIDYYSLHYYAPEDVKGQSRQDVDQAALVIAEVLAGKLDRVQKQMEQFAGGRRYGIALDEWSLKVDNEPVVTDDATSGRDLSQLGLHIGGLRLREALAEGTIFNLMHRRPGDFVLGSRTLLYAYLIGLVAIRRDSSFATPVMLMTELFATREACHALKTEIVSGTFSTKAMSPSFPAVKEAKYLDVSARLHPDAKTIDLFVINRNLEQSIDCTVQFTGGTIEPSVQAAILNAPSLWSRNSFDEPNQVRVEQTRLHSDSRILNYQFPAHSIVKFTVRRKEGG
jgi:alpha-N-arabinofuranosidase